MLLSSRLSLSNLIELCRSLRHYLGAGLPLVDAFRHQANKGALGVRPVAGRIVAALGHGVSLEDALQREEAFFPSLFLSLARVGEESGMLAEVFAELEKYYVRQRMLWRQFVARGTWPLIQFVLAIFVLAGLIFIMGMLTPPGGPGSKPLDPLGLGLAGPSGAMIFLGIVAGVLCVLGGIYWLMTRQLRDNAALDRFLLGLPAIGPCLRALALARFCMALRLTTETGMSITKAMRLSLQATGNRAFTARSDDIEAKLRRGEDLTLALADNGLFPEDFQHMIVVAEESGTLDQVLTHQAAHYHEESGRRLAALTSLAGYGVWLFVALIIIMAIFRIANWYIGLLG
ncbi:MAG TPA: type II secretion system F family protein [Gemmataceae bacterium]|nr:type II secretion system F family protein [Gemmataceae bacterium]